MKVQLLRCQNPNFCFELVDFRTKEEIMFVQSDWDYPGLASIFGYVPCFCGATDGTVDCPHKTKSQMMSEAFDFLCDHDLATTEYNE